MKKIEELTTGAWAFSETSCVAAQTSLFAVHEVGGDADLRRLRRLSRYLLGTQKLGSMIRKTNDTEHLEACTDADWSGDSIDWKSTSGGVLKVDFTTLREFMKKCEFPNAVKR